MRCEAHESGGQPLELTDTLTTLILDILREKLGRQVDAYVLPPPVFTAMKGQFIELNLDKGLLKAQFPVCESALNPYHTMQGGMVAAAVDNTLGPLSMLVAPPNVTRQLDMTYNRPVTVDMGYIVVIAQFQERKERWLYFRATVHSPKGQRLARAKAVHWIMDEK
jgi:acyl-coenzyme A thioesterase PaaI-like protein